MTVLRVPGPTAWVGGARSDQGEDSGVLVLAAEDLAQEELQVRGAWFRSARLSESRISARSSSLTPHRRGLASQQ